ncbi:MerR family transcriptional regulator [Paenibacillus donghaensis]|uniref:MerR family transcriptional regulator n=1 Tax=Paenibacillus donghaensis TaxID=414771 RepID=UPI0014718AB3|nr:MerR family transcriptional regulator [Paenibacillus donghaensis]
MLRISDFSILSQLSTKMLRHYADIDLLPPGFIDESTGYRYYYEHQLAVANKINMLKTMGLSLHLIKKILYEYDEDIHLMKFLNMQAAQLQEEINEKQDKILLINSMIKHLNAQKESSKYTVTAKKIPQRRVIYLRAQIKQYQDETLLWKRLSMIVHGQNVRLSYPHFNITVFYEEDVQNQRIDIEVQKCISGDYENLQEANIKIEKEQTVASFIYEGNYNKLSEVNETLARWILDNDYELNGSPFNIYHISPEEANEAANLLTEICFPIKKKTNIIG